MHTQLFQPFFHAFRSPPSAFCPWKQNDQAFCFELIKIKPKFRLTPKFQVIYHILLESKALTYYCRRGYMPWAKSQMRFLLITYHLQLTRLKSPDLPAFQLISEFLFSSASNLLDPQPSGIHVVPGSYQATAVSAAAILAAAAAGRPYL